jgi:hypothetical protein
MLGVGKDVPLATGNLSEGVLALVGRQARDVPRPLSNGLLREGTRRPHRPIPSGAAGRVRALFTTIATRAPLPHGRRQGRDEQS